MCKELAAPEVARLQAIVCEAVEPEPGESRPWPGCESPDKPFGDQAGELMIYISCFYRQNVHLALILRANAGGP